MDEKKLLDHVGHALTVSTYGKHEVVWNISIECGDCSEILWDKDLDDE